MTNYLKIFDTFEQAQKEANLLKKQWPNASPVDYFGQICVFLASDEDEISLDVFLAEDGDCVERFSAKLRPVEPDCDKCNDRGCNLCLMLEY
jgi:hypothetical protein